jgi:hypothetical protein
MSTPLRLMLTTTPREVSRVVVPGALYSTVALQQGEHVVPLRTPDVEVLESTHAELWRRAEGLLRRTTVHSDLTAIDTLPGLFMMVAGDGLAASRLLLLPELMAPLPYGGLLVAVPTSAQLFVVPLSSASGLDGLQTLAITANHSHETAEAPLSPNLFWYDGSRWQVLRVTSSGEDITVHPPKHFLAAMTRLAAMDFVRAAAEA